MSRDSRAVHGVLKKLQYKPPAAVTVLSPPPEVEALMESWSAEVSVRRRLGNRERFVLVFVRSQADVRRRANQLGRALADDAVLWLAYPMMASKRYVSDLSQMEGWQPLGDLGFEAVRQVAIDADWSALRFRRVDDIDRMDRSPSMALSERGKRRVGGDG